MVNYPNSQDSDVTLPRVDDNITEIGADAINALRDAIFAIEQNLGIGLAGSTADLSTRIGVSLDSLGNIKTSAITGLGLVTLPITDAQISATAAILESKLSLDHSTASLYNSISNLQINTQIALSYITDTGFKLEPHLQGITYRHIMQDIDVANSSISYFKNRFNIFRDNTDLYTVFGDLNNDFISHQKSDSTSTGTNPPINYGHMAAGIYLNSSNFSFIPQTTVDMQSFAEFIDNSNIFLLGTRIQTFYANGISRTSRSGILLDASFGQLIIPSTTVQVYLRHGSSSAPVDSIDNGDDIIEFEPDSTSIANNTFDAKFALVKIGDVLTVNYGTFSVNSLIKEKKFINDGLGNKKYIVRSDLKNSADGYFTAQVNKPLFNINKYGVMALAQANAPTSMLPSLICGNPRSPQVLGIGFNADQIDSTHYALYIQFYPTGNPTDQVVSLPAIDVTGNKGSTPGQYTLDTIVEATNNAFRAPGFNYRFIAYSYNGEFGIMQSDPYNNASFSIISGVLNSSGQYDINLSNTAYPNNIIGVPGSDDKDALGFGPNGAGVGSPPYSAAFSNSDIAQTPTKLFVPLTRNNYYINGVERERFELDPTQSLDIYGDGYWPATIVSKTVIPGVRIEVTYQVDLNLSASGLQAGKTIVVHTPSIVDSGRFFIKSIQFNDCSCDQGVYTQITVYDAIHSTGVTPFASSGVGTTVSLYFSCDSIGFNTENASDFANVAGPFKRSFEIYVNNDGYTFSHERGRMNISGSTELVNTINLYSSTELSYMDIYKISNKLRGYQFSSVTKINLQLTSYDSNTGIFSGYLCQWDGSTVSNQGPITVGKRGNVVRFYDQTNIEYIDFILNTSSLNSFSTTKNIDIQLFPTLSLDEEVMLIGNVEVNTATNKLSYLIDERQFGNISEEQLTTSALDYIAAPTQLLHENGIIRGFDILAVSSNNLSITGGTAIVNGKIIQLGNETVGIPVVQETLAPYGQSTTFNTITWFVCVNDKAEIEFVASTDFDPTTSSSTYDLIPVDHTRIFYAINPNATSPTAYQIKATYLADLISNYKNLTPIAIIKSTIAPSGSTYIVNSTVNQDARRFVYNGYGGLNKPFILGTNASFRSFDSLNAWLTQLLNFKSATEYANNIGQKVIVKGSNILSSATSLDYKYKVIFDGDSGSFTKSNITTGFNIGNNITFKNLTFIDGYDASLDTNYDTTILANNDSAFLYCNVDVVNGNKNITIDNCTFTSAYQYRYPFIVFNFADSGAVCENVDITNNIFLTNYAADDKLSVISFVGPAVASTSNIGPRLINCNILNNQCNKNQLILLSSPYVVGSSLIEDLIVAVNLKIQNNMCGAINILTKRDISTTTYNTGFAYDKYADVEISGNNCKFIYCGLANGRAINTAGSRVISGSLLNTGIFTGPLFITYNTVSFIHIGQRISSSYSPTTMSICVKNNNFFATDMSSATGYLNDYYVGFIGFPFTTIGLIIEKEVGL